MKITLKSPKQRELIFIGPFNIRGDEIVGRYGVSIMPFIDLQSDSLEKACAALNGGS